MPFKRAITRESKLNKWRLKKADTKLKKAVVAIIADYNRLMQDADDILNLTGKSSTMTPQQFRDHCTEHANTKPYPEFPQTPLYDQDLKGLKAGDDATKVAFVSLFAILSGEHAMAFNHVSLLKEPLMMLERTLASTYGTKYTNYFQQCYRRIECLSNLSVLKTLRMMKLVNSAFTSNPLGVDIHRITLHVLKSEDEYNTLFKTTILDAVSLGINWELYVNTTNDNAELKGVSNSWCYDQSKPFKAADNVVLIISKDGSIRVLVILRAFAPGIKSIAFAGGMFDPNETLKEAAARELCEEANITEASYNSYTKILTGEIPCEIRPCWDFRLRAHCAYIGAIFTIVIPPNTCLYVEP